MAIIDQLKWIIGADSKEFREEIARSEKSLKRGSRNMGRSLQRLNRGFGGMKTKLLGLLGAAGMGAFINQQLKAADETGKLAKQLATTSEELSTLTFAAEQNGAGIDDLRLGLRRLARGIQQAEDGTGSYGDLLDELGISTRDVNGNIKSTTDVLADVADLFQTLPDGARKTAIAYELLGDNGQRLIPLLNQGSEGMQQLQDRARELGLEISQNTADAAADLRDRLSELQAEATGLGNSILKDSLPFLNEFTATVAHAREESGSLQAAWVALGGIGEALFGDSLASRIRETRGELESLQNRQQNLLDLAEKQKDSKFFDVFFGDAEERAQALQPEIDKIRAQLAELEQEKTKADEAEKKRLEARRKQLEEEQQRRLEAARQLREAQAMKAEAEREEKDAAARIERGEKLIAQMQREIELDEKLTNVAEVRWEIENGAYANLTEAHQKRLLELAAEKDALEASKKAQEEAAKKAEEANKQIQEFGLEAARNMQTAFADFLFDPFEQGLEGMVQSFANAVRRMVAEALAAQALKSFFTALSGGAAPGGDGVGGFFAGLAESFAEGGPVSGPGTSTSDSIPARLSDGEFVQPANSTSHYGADFMEALRRRALPRDSVRSLLANSARMRPRIPAAPRFAEGGMAAGGGAAAQNLRLVLVDDRSNIGDYMTSSDGERVLLEVLQRNRSAVRRLVGG